MNKKVLFVEKKNGFDVESHGLLNEFKEVLNIKGIEKVRVINKYIIQGVKDEKSYESFKNAIFSEKNVDMVYENTIDLEGYKAFAVNLFQDNLIKELMLLNNVWNFYQREKNQKLNVLRL